MHIVTPFEEHVNIDLINIVKKQVDQLYARHQIFNLSLETLELTRRFNILYLSFENLELNEPVALNKFVSLTLHLERNLTLELN